MRAGQAQRVDPDLWPPARLWKDRPAGCFPACLNRAPWHLLYHFFRARMSACTRSSPCLSMRLPAHEWPLALCFCRPGWEDIFRMHQNQLLPVGSRLPQLAVFPLSLQARLGGHLPHEPEAAGGSHPARINRPHTGAAGAALAVCSCLLAAPACCWLHLLVVGCICLLLAASACCWLYLLARLVRALPGVCRMITPSSHMVG